MLPCKKISTSSYGIRYIRMAESQARSIKHTVGSKRKIIDGCIVEGKRVGSLLSANVIDPPPALLSFTRLLHVASESEYISNYVRVDSREKLHPMTRSGELAYSQEDGARYTLFYFGQPAEDLGQMKFEGYLAPAYVSQSNGSIFSSFFERSFSRNKLYVAVCYHDVVSKRNYLIRIEQQVINNFAGGFKIEEVHNYALRSTVVGIASGKFAVILNVAKTLNEDPEIKQESLVMLIVDLKLGIEDEEPEISGYPLPLYLLPYELQAREVGYIVAVDGDSNYITELKPAKTAISPIDIEVQEDGRILCAIKYQVQVNGQIDEQTPWMNSKSIGVGVVCFGTAVWGEGLSSIKIQSKEAFAWRGDNSVVLAMGNDPYFVRVGELATLFKGKVLRPTMLMDRDRVRRGLNPNIEKFVPPHTQELLDGVVVGNQEVLGFGPIFRGSKSSLEYPMGFGTGVEQDFYVNTSIFTALLNGTKAQISKDTIAVPRGGPTTGEHPEKCTSMGIMFTDGERYLYEALVGVPNFTTDFFLTLSCPQEEVRSADGTLLIPAVLIVTTISESKPIVFVRKGPIWPEDKPPLGFGEQEPEPWSSMPSHNKSVCTYFYVGNDLTYRKHGEVFYD